MPRRPEIGNVQLYPNRPLKKSDKNGYVLKFYCPLQGKRIRRNCGTRDRREARRILRECRERLLNGQYVASGGAITAEHEAVTAKPALAFSGDSGSGKSWQECYERYRHHQANRTRKRSLDDCIYGLQLVERILEKHRASQGLPEGLPVSQVMTLDILEFVQDRLLAGDECRYKQRSPNTVNSITAVLMAFARYCQRHGWIDSVPPLNKLDVDDVMKGRPITTEEFERMVAATPAVVGEMSAPSWRFALQILWESGFRVGDLMDFSWDDDRHIHPVWPRHSGQHPTIIVPPSQKNGRLQEIPMLPGLHQLLQSVLGELRSGWVVNLAAVTLELESREAFRPTSDDLQSLIKCYSNSSIARACGVSDTAVRKWLRQEGIRRTDEFHLATGEVPASKVADLRRHSLSSGGWLQDHRRPTVDHAGKIIAKIGKEARIVVQKADERTGQRERFASAHDLRRGCAQRLINAGISAETLKVIFRHRNFATTEKYYGASRSAQSAATEVAEKLKGAHNSPSLVGGLAGGTKEAPQLSTEEISKLRSFLNKL